MESVSCAASLDHGWSDLFFLKDSHSWLIAVHHRQLSLDSPAHLSTREGGPPKGRSAIHQSEFCRRSTRQDDRSWFPARMRYKVTLISCSAIGSRSTCPGSRRMGVSIWRTRSYPDLAKGAFGKIVKRTYLVLIDWNRILRAERTLLNTFYTWNDDPSNAEFWKEFEHHLSNYRFKFFS